MYVYYLLNLPHLDVLLLVVAHGCHLRILLLLLRVRLKTLRLSLCTKFALC